MIPCRCGKCMMAQSSLRSLQRKRADPGTPSRDSAKPIRLRIGHMTIERGLVTACAQAVSVSLDAVRAVVRSSSIAGSVYCRSALAGGSGKTFLQYLNAFYCNRRMSTLQRPCIESRCHNRGEACCKGIRHEQRSLTA